MCKMCGNDNCTATNEKHYVLDEGDLLALKNLCGTLVSMYNKQVDVIKVFAIMGEKKEIIRGLKGIAVQIDEKKVDMDAVMGCLFESHAQLGAVVNIFQKGIESFEMNEIQNIIKDMMEKMEGEIFKHLNVDSDKLQ